MMTNIMTHGILQILIVTKMSILRYSIVGEMYYLPLTEVDWNIKTQTTNGMEHIKAKNYPWEVMFTSSL